jgi:hypothetical protein
LKAAQVILILKLGNPPNYLTYYWPKSLSPTLFKVFGKKTVSPLNPRAVGWKQRGTTLTKTYWLLGRKSKFSTSHKLTIYETILKPIWTYKIQLWGTASTSNIEILEHFQSKALRIIVDASWYVPNTVIRSDFQIPTVKEEISRYSSQYSACLSAHPNGLIVNFIEQPDNRRLRRHLQMICLPDS